MTTQHTPGPWELGRASAPNTGAAPIRWKGESLAWACGKDSAHGFDEATARANARLLAAAPELLEALNNLAGGLVDYMNDDEAELPDVSEAIELIAKITNEPVMAA